MEQLTGPIPVQAKQLSKQAKPTCHQMKLSFYSTRIYSSYVFINICMITHVRSGLVTAVLHLQEKIISTECNTFGTKRNRPSLQPRISLQNALLPPQCPNEILHILPCCLACAPVVR